MGSDRRVVVTGMGIYSCVGTSVQEVRDALYSGRSGITLSPERKALGYASSLMGLVPPLDLKNELPRKMRQYLSEHGQYAYAATRDALAMAGIDAEQLGQRVVGILYGNDSSILAVDEGLTALRQKGKTFMMGSSNIFQSMNSTITMNLSTIFGLRGVNMTISGACASGSHSVGMAYLLIKAGLEDCILCGGAEEVNSYSVANFDALGAFSSREEAPAEASRPFDRNRDGLVPSGGAATLVLESLESAKRRGAPILAEVVGYGFSSNGSHISVPNVDGMVLALRRALEGAGVSPREIDYVNAHATSTPLGDHNEGLALLQIFGEEGPWVGSTKSLTGHEMWMAGASELIYSLIMLQEGFIAGTRNFSLPDEGLEALRVSAKRVDGAFNCFLSNSFGFGGTNSAIIMRRYIP